MTKKVRQLLQHDEMALSILVREYGCDAVCAAVRKLSVRGRGRPKKPEANSTIPTLMLFVDDVSRNLKASGVRNHKKLAFARAVEFHAATGHKTTAAAIEKAYYRERAAHLRRKPLT